MGISEYLDTLPPAQPGGRVLRTFRREALPISVRRTFGEVISGVGHTTAWFAAENATDMATLSVRTYDALDAALRPGSLDPAWLAAERGNLPRLLCNWRATPPDPFGGAGAAIDRSDPDQLRSMGTAVDRLCRDLEVALASGAGRDAASIAYREATYPSAKGKGSPWWQTGGQAGVLAGLVAITQGCTSLDEVQDRCYGLGAALPLSQYLLTRVQSRARIVDGHVPPKVRRVQGLPTVANYPVARMASALTALSKYARPGMLKPVDDAILDARERFSRGEVAVAEDASSFDDSLGYELLRYTVDRVVTRVGSQLVRGLGPLARRQLPLSLDCARAIATMPILVPVAGPTHSAALVSRRGGMPSGTRYTSLIDTWLNDSRIETTERFAGVKSTARWAFGDDTVVWFRDAASADRYLRASTGGAVPGFTMEAAPDVAYLQRHLPDGCTYLTRMVMATLQREATHEATNFATAALGIWARRQLLSGHPLRHVFDDICREPTIVGERVAAAFNLAVEASPLTLGHLASDMATGGASTSSTDEELNELLTRVMGPEWRALLGLAADAFAGRREVACDVVELAAAQLLGYSRPTDVPWKTQLNGTQATRIRAVL